MLLDRMVTRSEEPLTSKTVLQALFSREDLLASLSRFYQDVDIRLTQEHEIADYRHFTLDTSTFRFRHALEHETPAYLTKERYIKFHQFSLVTTGVTTSSSQSSSSTPVTQRSGIWVRVRLSSKNFVFTFRSPEDAQYFYQRLDHGTQKEVTGTEVTLYEHDKAAMNAIRNFVQ